MTVVKYQNWMWAFRKPNKAEHKIIFIVDTKYALLKNFNKNYFVHVALVYLFFTVAKYCVMNICYNSNIYSPVNGHLGHFQSFVQVSQRWISRSKIAES